MSSLPLGSCIDDNDDDDDDDDEPDMRGILINRLNLIDLDNDN